MPDILFENEDWDVHIQIYNNISGTTLEPIGTVEPFDYQNPDFEGLEIDGVIFKPQL